MIIFPGKLLTLCGVLAGLLALSGCASTPKPTASAVAARFYVELPSANATLATLPQSGVQIPIGPRPVFSEFDVTSAQVAQLELGRCLLFQLSPAAARDLYRLSVAHHGLRLVLFLNGAPFGARRLDSAIDDGMIAIFVEQPESALPALAAGVQETCAEVARARRKS
ncbi:hypothetical protein K0B96_07880 [Horticoccus luteus]|uniref:Preprotein translocase subunit SecD n=1 Tax=Horticoccus luteus TaxID=2862869 RepID=A0A8F9XIL0_9BACT|nr:hypothetical protein [Horticoccus luteus]QYM80515.1 hypothetical protein K0B96_07880 [Horticoccus luteus]